MKQILDLQNQKRKKYRREGCCHRAEYRRWWGSSTGTTHVVVHLSPLAWLSVDGSRRAGRQRWWSVVEEAVGGREEVVGGQQVVVVELGPDRSGGRRRDLASSGRRLPQARVEPLSLARSSSGSSASSRRRAVAGGGAQPWWCSPGSSASSRRRCARILMKGAEARADIHLRRPHEGVHRRGGGTATDPTRGRG